MALMCATSSCWTILVQMSRKRFLNNFTGAVPCCLAIRLNGHTNAGLYIEPFLAGQEVVRLACGYWMIGHLWDWNAYTWSGKWSSGVTHAQNSGRFCTFATNSYAQALWSYKMNANLHQSIYIQHKYSTDYLIPRVNVCHLDEISVCSKEITQIKAPRGNLRNSIHYKIMIFVVGHVLVSSLA